MFRRDLFSIFLVVLISVLSAAEFPSDVKRCKSVDIECQKNVLQEIIEKFHSKGHPGLKLIPFDPFKVKILTLPKINGKIGNIELLFTDIVLTGIGNVEVQKVSGLKEDGPNKFIYEIEGNFPQIGLTGPYSVDGQINKLALTGQGKSKITFDNVAAKIEGKFTIVEKDDKKYINVDQVHLDLKPTKSTFSFDNLFNGNVALGDSMNKLLNDNSVEVYNELKPVIEEAFGQIVLQIVKPVFSRIEYSEVFLPA